MKWFRKNKENSAKKAAQAESDEGQQTALQQSPEDALAASDNTIAQYDAAEQAVVTTATDTSKHASNNNHKIAAETQQEPSKAGLFSRLKQGLEKTTQSFSSGIGTLFLGAKEIDEDLLEEIEMQMIMADVGIDATNKIIGDLTGQVERKELYDANALYQSLQKALHHLLNEVEQPLVVPAPAHSNIPFVILMVGVNGAGKTTTIGKLAKRFQAEGKKVMLAAGDTFRAAAVEQLQVWGERNDVEVITQHKGADSAAVIYEGLDTAIKQGADILIADTAGRLHSQDNLMEELKKIVRVIKKREPSAPHEVMLVLDASTGQNAIAQARHFQQAVGVTGLTVTKLDGTAKGGVVFAISEQLKLPIRFIGVGEKVDDLRPFVADDFVRALFEK